MDDWRENMEDKLERNKLGMYMMDKFVDDMQAVCEAVELGTRQDELEICMEAGG